MFDRAVGPSFNFPRPIAYLLAVLWEPRADDQPDCPQKLLLQIRQVRTQIRRELESLNSEAPLSQQTGRLEAILRNLLPPLRDAALQHDHHAMASHLEEADRVSRGERPLPTAKKDVVPPTLPARKPVQEGRPPVGFWR